MNEATNSRVQYAVSVVRSMFQFGNYIYRETYFPWSGAGVY